MWVNQQVCMMDVRFDMLVFWIWGLDICMILNINYWGEGIKIWEMEEVDI